MTALLTVPNVFRLVGAGMLIYAFQDLPYGYYQLLRWVACGAFLATAYLAAKQGNLSWAWLLGIAAAIFNPFFPVRLTKEVWRWADLAAAALMLLSLYFVPGRLTRE